MNVVISVAIVALTLTVIFANASFARALRWGAAWGLFYSYWILAPAFLQSHHLHIDGFGTFLLVAGLFATGGGVLGVALTFVSLLPWGIAGLWSRGKPALVRVVTLPGALLPLAYIGLASLIEYVKFGRFVSVERSEGQAQVGLSLLILAAITLLARTKLASRPGFLTGMRRMTLTGVVGGVALLPIRDGLSPPPDVKPDPLVKRGNGAARPLVIIALDGVGWNVAEPLLRKGELPWLESVIARGQRGTVIGQWPPHWSGPAWASIVTGFGREDTGVFEDLLADAPGLPDLQLPLQLDLRLNPLLVAELELLSRGLMSALPMPRRHLRRSPIWERVGAAGGRVGVVRFPFTYPTTNQSIAVVSNVTSLDLWDFAISGGIDSAQLVSPARQAADVLSLFARPRQASLTSLRRILPNPGWKDSPADVNRIWVLDRLVDINDKTFAAAEYLLATTGPFDLFMLHVSGIDSVSHAFWKYRFPESFPDSPPEVENVGTLGRVIDRYLQEVDMRLGLILREMPDANVLVLADHGQSASPRHEVWSGWHSPEGVFAAAGPDVPASSVMRRVDYQEIVPWALDIMGYEVPADLPKRGTRLRTLGRGN